MGQAHLNRLGVILNSINAQFGTAYDTTPTSTVWARNMALARCIDAVWSASQRFANQYDPTRMTDFLPRWEAILGLYPSATDSDRVRRQRVATSIARIGTTTTYQYLVDTLKALLGTGVFLSVVHTPSASAVVVTPTGWPMGSHADPNRTWYSTVAYAAIQVQQPAGMDDGTFYQAASSIYPVLDAILPAWVTYSWFRNASTGVQNFILDDPHNLDNEAFGS